MRHHALALLAIWAIADSGFAQIALDGSFGPSGPLATVDGNTVIPAEVGRRVGGNLFHSFSEFSVPPQQAATFLGDPGIENVISRVTGGMPSQIDGTLTVAMPNANLYLANPSGVFIGPNASLNMPGSFYATTAHTLHFGDGISLDARGGEASLSVAPVTAFGFLAAGAGIDVVAAQLGVAPTRTIALVGGDINVQAGALLQAPGGRVQLASAAGAGQITLGENGIATTPEMPLGRVTLQQGGRAEVSFPAGGAVDIRAREVALLGGALLADTVEAPGGRVTVVADEAITLAGGGAIVSNVAGPGRGLGITLQAGQIVIDGRGQAPQPTGIVSVLVPDAPGQGGDITLLADTVTITEALIDATSIGPGQGSAITITADALEIVGGDQTPPRPQLFTAGIAAPTVGPGRGGDITLNVGQLTIRNIAGIEQTTVGPGQGGNLMVDATSILLDANDLGTPLFVEGVEGVAGQFPNGFAADVVASGRGGNISVRASEDLIMQRGASISAIAVGDGPGGDIDVTVGGDVILDANGRSFINAIVTNSIGGTGDAGDVTVVAGGDVVVLNGASINSNSGGFGDTGNVTIRADRFIMDGAPDITTDVGSETAGGGVGNTVLVEVNELEIRGGATIDVTTSGSADGGRAIIRANRVTLADGGSILSVTAGSGEGGDIEIQTDHLTIRSGGAILADSANVRLLPPGIPNFDNGEGLGNAGDVNIAASESVILSSGGVITTQATAAAGGSITLRTRSLQLRDKASLTASVTSGSGGGGNIAIAAEQILALDQSAITARADQGQGGNIAIDAVVFLRAQRAVVDASSNLSGNDGTVAINSVELDISESIIALSSEFGLVTVLGNNCRAIAAGESSLIVSNGALLPTLASTSLSRSIDLPIVARQPGMAYGSATLHSDSAQALALPTPALAGCRGTTS